MDNEPRVTEYRECQTCKEVLPEDKFYKPRAKEGKTYPRKNCSSCHKQKQNKSKRDKKSALISLAGGSCEVCGYDKCEAALEFHHKDPSNKDKEVSKLNMKAAVVEMKKCALLCSNCHREVHAGRIEL